MMNTQNSLQKAEQYCEVNQLRLTTPRRLVLEILLKNQKPMGAYDVLEELGQFIERPKPPTAYRAIDFWREQGFVHKIESLNAYIVCCENHENHGHNTHFLICDDCSSVKELHHHKHKDETLPNGFVAKKTFTETNGTCETCSQES